MAASMLGIAAARRRLTALTHAVRDGQVGEVVITSNGRPLARLVPIHDPDPDRLGLRALDPASPPWFAEETR